MTKYVLSEYGRAQILRVLKQVENRSPVRAFDLAEAFDAINTTTPDQSTLLDKFTLNLAKYLGSSGISWHLRSDAKKKELLAQARQILLGKHGKV